jgi:hypothetical protein
VRRRVVVHRGMDRRTWSASFPRRSTSSSFHSIRIGTASIWGTPGIPRRCWPTE